MQHSSDKFFTVLIRLFFSLSEHISNKRDTKDKKEHSFSDFPRTALDKKSVCITLFQNKTVKGLIHIP